MIKRTFVISILIIVFIFGVSAIVAFFSLNKLSNEMKMIGIAEESLLQRQRLNEYIIRLQHIEVNSQSLHLITRNIEGFIAGCIECHRMDSASEIDKSSADDALFVINRLSIMNSRLKELSDGRNIYPQEVKILFKKMDELTTDALIKGRNLMNSRVQKGVLALRFVNILTVLLIFAGGLLLVGVFILVRNSLERNIFSIIKASEEIAKGRSVAEVDFSKDFEPVRSAFLKLQEDLKKKEEEIRIIATRAAQAEKLIALGELVAGVSHELNNPLQIIVGYTEMIMTDNSAPEHLRTISSRIYDSALRASRIVRNLREFARQREAIREPVDLRQIVDKVIEILDYEFTSSGIKILKDYGDIPPVMADSAQLQQVVLNLFKNAYDAIVETGRGEGTVKVSLRKGDGLVIIEISDDGTGIPEELINRIFEPFFTTKPVGKGTGLGLSITYGIIKAHNGNISVKSKPGEGTTFIIELPAF